MGIYGDYETEKRSHGIAITGVKAAPAYLAAFKI